MSFFGQGNVSRANVTFLVEAFEKQVSCSLSLATQMDNMLDEVPCLLEDQYEYTVYYKNEVLISM